jgi:hypothetical protein
MEKREIKFKAWHKVDGWCGAFAVHQSGLIDYGSGWMTQEEANMVLVESTGKKGFNDKDLYEGDIVFYEEATDEGDRRFWLVILWIKEWSMFASLMLDEYKKYIEHGIEELDETMFWTYTLEVSEHFHYAGNLFENPELLENE